MTSIAENLARVQREIVEACNSAQRPRADVALMAVSKVHSVELLLEAYDAGQRLFGENRVQEVQAKQPFYAHLGDLQMHLIGPLQSNKTNRAAELFASVDTVDSIKLAGRLDAAAAVLGKVLPVSIEVKLSPEETKHGLPPEDLPALLEALRTMEHLRPEGLMTVPPWSEDAEVARPYFRELRRLRDESLATIPTLVGLSMGMSNDFAVAIEEGSTCIRVGTAIFGKRPKPA